MLDSLESVSTGSKPSLSKALEGARPGLVAWRDGGTEGRVLDSLERVPWHSAMGSSTGTVDVTLTDHGQGVSSPAS